MTKDEALRLALEALELFATSYSDGNAAITALREALAEQPAQQEPFGHVTVRRLSQRFENHADQFHFYPAGQSPYLDNVDELHAVYTRPQAREPLTDEQIYKIANDLFYGNGPCDTLTMCRAIETAHGIGEKK